MIIFMYLLMGIFFVFAFIVIIYEIISRAVCQGILSAHKEIKKMERESDQSEEVV